MKALQKIAIAADNTDLDNQLYRAVQALESQLFKVDEIHILYARNLNYLERSYINDHQEFLELNTILENKIKDEIANAATSILGDKLNLQIHILTGSPVEEILKYTEQKGSDVIIVGKKVRKVRSGRIAKELIRRLEIPVLVIPEEFKTDWHLESILVPYDFSDLSNEALKSAATFQGNSGDVNVVCFHAIDSPVLTSEMIASSHKLIQIMEESRNEDFKGQLKKLGIVSPIELKLQNTINSFTPKEILKYADRNKFSMIIMGAKGHSAFERFFLGSVTEKLISINNNLPLLIVK